LQAAEGYGACLPCAASADSLSSASSAVMCTGAMICVVFAAAAACTVLPSRMTRGSSTFACALSQNTCVDTRAATMLSTDGTTPSVIHSHATSGSTLPKESVVSDRLTILVPVNSPVTPGLGLATAPASVRCRFGGDSIVSLVACAALVVSSGAVSASRAHSLMSSMLQPLWLRESRLEARSHAARTCPSASR